MATPIESTAAVVIAAPTLALLFTFWPFGLAFIASCVALIYIVATDLNVAIKNIVGSTLIGGSLSQVSPVFVLPVLKHFYPEFLSLAESAQMPMTALLAILIGLFTQRLLPRAISRLEKMIDGQ